MATVVMPTQLQIQIPASNRGKLSQSTSELPAFGISTYSYRFNSPSDQVRGATRKHVLATFPEHSLTPETTEEFMCNDREGRSPALKTRWLESPDPRQIPGGPSSTNSMTPLTAGEDVLAEITYARIVGLPLASPSIDKLSLVETSPLNSRRPTRIPHPSPTILASDRPLSYLEIESPSFLPERKSSLPMDCVIPIESGTFGRTEEKLLLSLNQSSPSEIVERAEQSGKPKRISRRLPIPDFDIPPVSPFSKPIIPPREKSVEFRIEMKEDDSISDLNRGVRIPIFTRASSNLSLRNQLERYQFPVVIKEKEVHRESLPLPTRIDFETHRRQSVRSKVAPWEVKHAYMQTVPTTKENGEDMIAHDSRRKWKVLIGVSVLFLVVVLIADMVLVDIEIFGRAPPSQPGAV